VPYYIHQVNGVKLADILFPLLSVCVCVCVCVGRQGSLALAGSLSRRRKTPLPLGSEYVSLETWDDGARRRLKLKTSGRRLGGQLAVGV